MIELRDVCFTRDNKKILNNVNLKLDSNKFIAITGPNGSGKSTLAKIVMGIEKPDSGKIYFNGKDITEASVTERAKMGLGFAFQQPVKFKGITVKDLINLAAGNNLKMAEICDYLGDVGLCAKEYIDREVDGSLSGGELKRIEIAMIAAKKSVFTIFDEPEAGIDLWSFNNLIEVFGDMKEETKGSILVISHQERILEIADEIVLLVNGQVDSVGSKEEIFPKIMKNTIKCRHLKREE